MLPEILLALVVLLVVLAYYLYRRSSYSDEKQYKKQVELEKALQERDAARASKDEADRLMGKQQLEIEEKEATIAGLAKLVEEQDKEIDELQSARRKLKSSLFYTEQELKRVEGLLRQRAPPGLATPQTATRNVLRHDATPRTGMTTLLALASTPARPPSGCDLATGSTAAVMPTPDFVTGSRACAFTRGEFRQEDDEASSGRVEPQESPAQDEHEQVRKEVARLEALEANLREELQQARDDASQLEAKFRQELEHARQEATRLAEQLGAARGKVAEGEAESKSLKRRLSTVQAECKALGERLVEAENLATAGSRMAGATSAKTEEVADSAETSLAAQFEAEMQRLRAEHEVEMAVKAELVAALQAELEEMARRNASLSSDTEKVQVDREQLVMTCSDLQLELNRVREQLRSAITERESQEKTLQLTVDELEFENQRVNGLSSEVERSKHMVLNIDRRVLAMEGWGVRRFRDLGQGLEELHRLAQQLTEMLDERNARCGALEAQVVEFETDLELVAAECHRLGMRAKELGAQREGLQADVGKLAGMCTELEVDRSAAVAALLAIRSERDELARQRKALGEEVEGLESRFAAAAAQGATAASRAAQLEEQLAAEAARTAELTAQAAELLWELEAANMERAKLRDQVAEANAQLDAARYQLQQLQKTSAATTERLHERVVAAEGVAQELTEQLRRAKDERDRVVAESEATQTGLKDALSVAEKRHATMCCEMQAVESRLAASQADVLQARAEASAMLAQLTAAAATIEEGKIRALQTAQQWRAEADDLVAQMAAAAKSLEVRNGDINALNQQLALIEAATSERAGQLEAAVLSLASAEDLSKEEASILSQLQTQFAEAAAEAADQSIGELAALRMRLVMAEGVTADLDFIRTKLAEAEAQAAELGPLRERLSALEAEAAELGPLRTKLAEAEAQAAELGPLRGRLSALEAEAAELGPLRTKLAEAEAQAAELGPLRERLASLKAEAAEVGVLRAQLGATEAALLRAEVSLAAALAELAALDLASKGRYDALMAEHEQFVAAAEAAMTARDSEVATQRSEVSDLSSKLQHIQREFDAAKGDLQVSEQQRLVLEHRLAEEREAAKASLSDLAAKMAHVEEKNRCTAAASASLIRVLDLQAGELRAFLETAMSKVAAGDAAGATVVTSATADAIGEFEALPLSEYAEEGRRVVAFLGQVRGLMGHCSELAERMRQAEDCMVAARDQNRLLTSQLAEMDQQLSAVTTAAEQAIRAAVAAAAVTKAPLTPLRGRVAKGESREAGPGGAVVGSDGKGSGGSGDSSSVECTPQRDQDAGRRPRLGMPSAGPRANASGASGTPDAASSLPAAPDAAAATVTAPTPTSERLACVPAAAEAAEIGRSSRRMSQADVDAQVEGLVSLAAQLAVLQSCSEEAEDEMLELRAEKERFQQELEAYAAQVSDLAATASRHVSASASRRATRSLQASRRASRRTSRHHTGGVADANPEGSPSHRGEVDAGLDLQAAMAALVASPPTAAGLEGRTGSTAGSGRPSAGGSGGDGAVVLGADQQRELDGLRRHLEALADMDAAAAELAEQAEEERLQLEAEAAVLRRRLQEVQDNQAAEAQRMDALLAERSALEQEREHLTNRCGQLESESCKLKELCEQLEYQRAELADRSSTLEQYRDELSSQYDKALQERGELKGQYEKALKERDELTSQYDKALQERIELTSQYEKALQERIELTSQYEKALQERDELKGQYDKALQERNELKVQKDKALQEWDELKGQFDKALQERDELENQKDKALQEWDELQGQFDKALQERDELKGQYDKALQERDELKDQNDKLLVQLKEVARAHSKISELRVQYDATQQDLRASLESKASLAAELEAKKAELEEGLQPYLLSPRTVRRNTTFPNLNLRSPTTRTASERTLGPRQSPPAASPPDARPASAASPGGLGWQLLMDCSPNLGESEMSSPSSLWPSAEDAALAAAGCVGAPSSDCRGGVARGASFRASVASPPRLTSQDRLDAAASSSGAPMASTPSGSSPSSGCSSGDALLTVCFDSPPAGLRASQGPSHDLLFATGSTDADQASRTLLNSDSVDSFTPGAASSAAGSVVLSSPLPQPPPERPKREVPPAHVGASAGPGNRFGAGARAGPGATAGAGAGAVPAGPGWGGPPGSLSWRAAVVLTEMDSGAPPELEGIWSDVIHDT